LAAVKIQWKTIQNLSKGEAVATGASVADEDEAPSIFASVKKPCVVFVADPTASMADFEKIETVVFANEKIGLAMKAFDALRIAPEDAESDPILGGHGKGVPRLLVVDPAKEKVKVLEEKKIKVSGLYKLMKSTAGSFYKEKLDKCVKAHLKMLTEQDQLANEVETLKEKEGGLAGESGKKAEKDLEKIKEELAEVQGAIKELEEKQSEVWKLTPKKAVA
jgi:hypothetical protein